MSGRWLQTQLLSRMIGSPLPAWPKWGAPVPLRKLSLQRLNVPPLFTTKSDTGSSSTDQITNNQNLTLSGTAADSSTVTLYRAGVTAAIGTATADGSGNWNFDYSGTTLAEGTYGFTGTVTTNTYTSALSQPFLVTVDLTAPTVNLLMDSNTADPTPQVRVTAWDSVGMPATATVTLDVDLNDNGNFTDPGETDYATGTMTNGVAVFDLSPALAAGTVRVRARVDDLAGNEGISNVRTVTISNYSGYTLTDTTLSVDPLQGNAQELLGTLTDTHTLDLDQSLGTSVSNNPALVYNSDRVSVEPIIAAMLQTDSSIPLPSTITAQLTLGWRHSPDRSDLLHHRLQRRAATLAGTAGGQSRQHDWPAHL